jgi:hypothetical protein
MISVSSQVKPSVPELTNELDRGLAKFRQTDISLVIYS